MKEYKDELEEVGMKLYYNGSPIKWGNPKTGKITEVMKKGKYIITRKTANYIFLKPARKNAVTEHRLYLSEIHSIKIVELADMTCSAGLIFMNLNPPTWILWDDEMETRFKKARKYNKSRG